MAGRLVRVLLTGALLIPSGPLPAADDAAKPPGADKSATTSLMETGAGVLQNDEPIDQLSIHLVGFHPMKADPAHQMEAHHYCHQVNEDFAQCVLFDGDTAAANMNGIEYIISEKLFETLPADEKAYWHPHNYEILSGQLVAPGIPDAVEHRLMAGKMNSYGKTWHVWRTGMPGETGDALPIGDPQLAWSFNRDGEERPGLVAARDRTLGVDTAAKRKGRADLAAAANPQCGVAAIASRFPDARAVPGVVARTDGCPRDPGSATPAP